MTMIVQLASKQDIREKIYELSCQLEQCELGSIEPQYRPGILAEIERLREKLKEM